jgi:hypothetical protein
MYAFAVRSPVLAVASVGSAPKFSVATVASEADDATPASARGLSEVVLSRQRDSMGSMATRAAADTIRRERTCRFAGAHLDWPLDSLELLPIGISSSLEIPWHPPGVPAFWARRMPSLFPIHSRQTGNSCQFVTAQFPILYEIQIDFVTLADANDR